MQEKDYYRLVKAYSASGGVEILKWYDKHVAETTSVSCLFHCPLTTCEECPIYKKAENTLYGLQYDHSKFKHIVEKEFPELFI